MTNDFHSLCAKCGKAQTRATGMEPGPAPVPGDVIVCMDCGAVLRLTDRRDGRWWITERQPLEELDDETRRQLDRIEAARYVVQLERFEAKYKTKL